MTIKIAIINTPNADALAALHRSCFERGWDAVSLQEMLSIAGTMAFVTENGFGVMRKLVDEAEILTLAVLPTARGQGVGRAIVTAMQEWAAAQGVNALFLEVDETNKPAVALYERCGFEVISHRKAYYRHADGTQSQALVMRTSLSGHK